MSSYSGLQDDEEESNDEEVEFDVVDEADDNYKIRMDDRFTKNNKEKKKSQQNRGHIMISLHEESPSATQETLEFDGFDVTPTKEDKQQINDDNMNNNNNNNNNNNDSNAQFIISNNKNNDDLMDNDNSSKTKRKKKKKKKNKYKRSKKGNDEIDLMPLSSKINEMNTNKMNTNNANNEEIAGENIDDEEYGVRSHKKKRKKKRRKQLTRNDRIKQYIKSEVKWWLFVGTMLSIFTFSYSAINVGIAEDLVIFYANYTDLKCHYPLEPDTTETEQKLIGDVLTHKIIRDFFTSSAGVCILSLFGLIIGGILICSRDCAKNARASLLIAISYLIIFIIGNLLLFIWNIILCMNVMDQLHEFLTGLSHCDDDSAKQEAQSLLNEFEILAVLILPMIFIIICTTWYIKVKLC